MEIDPRSLPDLFEQLRDQNNIPKHEKNKKKQLIKITQIVVNISFFLILNVMFLCFWLLLSKSELLGPSYDQKTEMFNDQKSNDYQSLSVTTFQFTGAEHKIPYIQLSCHT